MAPHDGRATVHFRRSALLFDDRPYLAVKDPCPVRFRGRWHLYGTGVRPDHRLEILHAVAAEVTGPWRLQAPLVMPQVAGNCVAAPGVISDGSALHLFVQTEFNVPGGRIEHLSSADGAMFVRRDTALTSLPDTGEAGIYDAHPAEIAGHRYLTYSAFSVTGQPDIYLARSITGSWDGPFERLGSILDHPQVEWHNQPGDPDYEWGLEGAQLLELPDGRVLLDAVCFLPGAPSGCRQRLFIAVAERPQGPYRVLGPAVDPLNGPDTGENGHGGAVVDDGAVVLLFQERTAGGRWSYGLARAVLDPAESGDVREVA